MSDALLLLTLTIPSGCVVDTTPDPATTCTTACETDSGTVATADSDSAPPEDSTGTTESGPPVDADGDGYSVAAGDCDDADASRNPGAAEVLDGVDQDCDGEPDDGLRVAETYLRAEVVVSNGTYMSGRTWTEFRNEVGDVICTFEAPWYEGIAPDTSCPECTWAFGLEGGAWTSRGTSCEWLQLEWYDLDYLNDRAETGAYDEAYGYSPWALDWPTETFLVYQQIWLYDSERARWDQTGAYNSNSYRADHVYEYGSGTYVFGGRWYSFYY